jgi:hypothetical protein
MGPCPFPQMTLQNRPYNWCSALPGLLLGLLVLVVYLPSLSGQFLWDEDSNVTKRAPLRSLSGLSRIWFEPGATQQYYPLTHTSFWLDYHLWGLNPFGYRLENVLLHALSAILLWLILRRIEVKGAWLGAALFALLSGLRRVGRLDHRTKEYPLRILFPRGSPRLARILATRTSHSQK